MELVHSGCRRGRNGDGASAGQVVSYLTLGTCVAPPVRTLRCVNKTWPLRSDGHGEALRIQVNARRADGSASGCSMLSVGRAGVEECCCCCCCCC
ncbi:hypothetical protein F2P81_006862 [Scophthalmus maximus]|uniref:Uncharacterized protein n=1 Tax=Scophthalmus maximus TaxID=52904 RepID=A0A6A4TCR5_SCOMX|nr:hypothetical protein F2P81_006862 [Scophthalmus maximus]